MVMSAAGGEGSRQLFFRQDFCLSPPVTLFIDTFNLKSFNMKNYLAAMLFAMVFSTVSLSGETQYIECPVSHVTVFSRGAQLSGTASVTLLAGTHDYVIGGLSPHIDANTIQVKGEGAFTIMGVTHRNNFLENLSESEAVATLRDRIERLRLQIEDEETALEVLREREAFLKANYDVVSAKSAITAEQLRALIEIYGTSTESVKGAILKKNRTIKGYREEMEKLEKQLSSSVARSRMPSGEVVVTLSSDKAAAGRLMLSYMVMNAGWVPSYDIRVSDITDPATIIYRAGIWQNSGVDWKDVRVSLSNASPMTAGSLPKLYPWYIDFQLLPVVKSSLLSGKVSGINKRALDEPVIAEMEAVDEELYAYASMSVSVNESNISFSFDINVPKTIATGGRQETVELQRLTVPATYSYAATPKLTPTAYLMGYITGWEKYNLLPGEANIYFGNTFTGKGYIDTSTLTDTLPVSLGADNSITVKRERRTDLTTRRMIGSNQVETRSFLISVRNNKGSAVSVRLRDQLPVSRQGNMTVDPVELSGGRHDSATGEVTWDLEIAPSATRELTFTYSVRYPKNQKVILE